MNKYFEKILIAVLLIVIALMYRSCSNNQEQAQMYQAAQDSLTVTTNKLGQEKAQIELLVANNQKDLLKLKTNDSTIIHLQSVVKKYKGKLAAATVLSNSTSDNGSTATTIIKSDTVIVGATKLVFPTYTTKWDEQWSKGLITANKDTIFRHVLVRNEYEITQGYEKQGFLKPKKPVVTILNLNPNTATHELRSFTVEPENKRTSIGVGAMYGFDIMSLKPTIVVGVGVQYSIIKL